MKGTSNETPARATVPMRKFFFLLLFLCVGQSLGAQTIIELKPGGSVRGKTVDDYTEEQQLTERLRADSLQYIDYIRRGFNALYADSLDEAEDLLNAAVKLRPDAPGNYVLRYNLGLIDVSRGHYDKAVSKFDLILKNYPDHYDARIARAESNLQLGKAAEAIEDANVMLPILHSDDFPPEIQERALFVKAAANYQLRLYVEACSILETLLKRNPSKENARILEALCLEHMGQPKEALNRLNFIVAANPQSIDALSTRAAVESGLELNALARADYDRLIEMEPNESEFYIERARVLIRLDEKTAARADLDKAVALGVPMGVVQALYLLTVKK